MKKMIMIIAFIALLAFALSACDPACELAPTDTVTQAEPAKADEAKAVLLSEDDLLVLPDATLAAMVAQIAGVDADKMTVGDASAVKTLYLPGSGVADLTGIENLVGLESIDVRGLSVKDYTPLLLLEDVEVHAVFGTIKEALSYEQLNQIDKLVVYVMYEQGPQLLQEAAKLTHLYGLYYYDFGNASGEREIDLSILSGLSKLEILDAHRCGIKDISALSSLENLRILDIGQNLFTDLSPLTACPRIESLRLYGIIAQDLSPLQGMASLKSLDLGGCGLKDVASLSSLTGLKELNLHGNDISDISPLAALIDLQSLDLYGNEVKELESLSGMASLEVLNIGYNKGLAGLEELNLSRNQISSIAPLSALKSLRALYLGGNQIGDLLPLAGMTLLEELGLEGNTFTDITPIAGCTELRVLLFSGDSQLGRSAGGLDDITPLANFTKLESLKLKAMGIGSNVGKFEAGGWEDYAEILVQLKNIKTLDVSNNFMNDVSELREMKSLEELDLSFCPIRDLSVLKELPNLKKFTMALLDDAKDQETLDVVKYLKEKGVEVNN